MTARQMLQLAKSFKDASVYATAQVFKKGIAVRSISFDSDIPMLNHHFSSQLRGQLLQKAVVLLVCAPLPLLFFGLARLTF